MIEIFEQAIIGSLYLYDDLRQQMILSITSEDFKNPKAQQAFTAVSKNPKLDKIAIIHQLANSEVKEYVLEAVQLAPVKSNVIITLNEFIRLASDRKFNERLQVLALSGSNPDELEKVIAEKRNRQRIEISSSEKYLAEYSQVLEYVPTGFPVLDNYLNGGFIRGTVATIGGRPSSGKTTQAINIIRNIAFNTNLKIMMFSLEMTIRMVYDKLVADICNIPYDIAQSHRLTKKQHDCVKTAVESLKTLSVYDDIYCVEDIISQIYSSKPDVVCIDYTQIIRSKQEFKDPRIRIDYISQRLKQCGKDTGCVIIVLSQVNRGGKDMPTMSDLKESGGLEQDSDYIMLIHRPYVVDKSNREYKPSDTKLKLDKNKFGNCTILKYDFNGRFQRFTEIGEDNEENSVTQSIARPINNNSDDLDFLGE